MPRETIVNLERILQNVPRLKSLEIEHSDLSSVFLPVTLEELLCHSDEMLLRGRILPALKKLEIIVGHLKSDVGQFPRGVVDLEVEYWKVTGDFLMWPSGLKKLHLSCRSFDSPRIPALPTTLESLSLLYHCYHTIVVAFPRDLKELTLMTNEGGACDVATARFPVTLEYLDMNCKNVDSSRLPQGLKVLKVRTQNCLTQFTPNLEHLEYEFRISEKWDHFSDRNLDYQHLRFQFPVTLRILKLACDVYYTFQLNLDLPELELMELYNFCGPAAPSVKTVKLSSLYDGTKFDRLFYHFAVPDGVRKLEAPHPLKEYPDSITDLQIRLFDPQTAPPFPKSLRHLTLEKPFSVIEGITLPPSLCKVHFVSGVINKSKAIQIPRPFGILQ